MFARKLIPPAAGQKKFAPNLGRISQAIQSFGDGRPDAVLVLMVIRIASPTDE
jgi:hypothetical protein